MAIGWILKVIPWGDIVTAAPSVARGARELWRNARRTDDEAPLAQNAPALETPEERLTALVARVQAFEARHAALERELAASAELVASLAEQNQRLVGAVEILRVRTRLLLGAAALLGLAALALAWRLFA